LARIQDQLNQIVYAHHYDWRLLICVIFSVSQLERVYDTHKYTRIIKNYEIDRIELLKIFQRFFSLNKHIFEPQKN